MKIKQQNIQSLPEYSTLLKRLRLQTPTRVRSSTRVVLESLSPKDSDSRLESLLKTRLPLQKRVGLQDKKETSLIIIN